MKIELTDIQLNGIADKEILKLKKENAALRRKLVKLEEKLKFEKDGMNLSKEWREKIRNISFQLVEALDSAGWKEYDERI